MSHFRAYMCRVDETDRTGHHVVVVGVVNQERKPGTVFNVQFVSHVVTSLHHSDLMGV